MTHRPSLQEKDHRGSEECSLADWIVSSIVDFRCTLNDEITLITGETEAFDVVMETRGRLSLLSLQVRPMRIREGSRSKGV